METTETPVHDCARRVRSEYMEMPGLALTRDQMLYFWSLDTPLCDAVVGQLVDAGFLWCRANRTYVRVHARP